MVERGPNPRVVLAPICPKAIRDAKSLTSRLSRFRRVSKVAMIFIDSPIVNSQVQNAFRTCPRDWTGTATMGNLEKEHLPTMEAVTIPSYGRRDGLRDGLALERHGDHRGDSLIGQGPRGIGEQEYRRPPGEQRRRKR